MTEATLKDPGSRRAPMRNPFARINRLFLLTVLVPTLIATIYFGFVASDVYISESRFVVRSPQRQTPTGIGALLQGAGFSRSQDDTFSVQDFMLSRDALRDLDAKLGIFKMFGDSEIDRLSRFAGLDPDKSFEALHRYYQKHVAVNLDSASSISSLRVSAYAADDAFKINEMLLNMGESLINQLNERGRQDMIRFSTSEVAVAEASAKAAALALSGYRNEKSVFDPERQSALQLQQISKLQDELIANKMQLAQIQLLSPSNPQIASIQKRSQTLEAAINAEMGKVAGNGSSLTTKSADYERLVLERGFAEKQLGGALASLEQARNEAQRKQLYLERIVQPSKPDVAVEPRRLRAILTTLILGLIAWGILNILLAGVREHKD